MNNNTSPVIQISKKPQTEMKENFSVGSLTLTHSTFSYPPTPIRLESDPFVRKINSALR